MSPKKKVTLWKDVGTWLGGLLQALLVALAARGVDSIDQLNRNVATLLERTSNQGAAITRLEGRMDALEPKKGK